jgi:hypothetical protein
MHLRRGEIPFFDFNFSQVCGMVLCNMHREPEFSAQQKLTP